MKAKDIQEKLNQKMEDKRCKRDFKYYNEVTSLLNELNAVRRIEGQGFLTLPSHQVGFMKSIIPIGNKPKRTNVRGNKIFETSVYGSRYNFDKLLLPLGFQQFDTSQDEACFGVWVSKEHLCTVTFAEGDVTVCMCRNREHYNAEIKDCIEYYKAGFICKTIDDKTGKMTTYVQDRKQFLIPIDNNPE